MGDQKGSVRWGSATGRGVVAAATLGSGIVMLDGSVVNVALRTIGESLDASLAQLQWVSNGYLLTLAGLILLGGALGDRYGRRRIFMVGVVWFTLASLLCGLAPDIEWLIAGRALQGIGGALLTPGSLAMIQGSFDSRDRATAIGAWSGLGGVATAIGPFVGGMLVEHGDWRWIFLLNVPLAVVTLACTWRWVPESRNPDAATFDLPGAALGSLALAALTWALTDPSMLAPGMVAAVVLGAGFVVTEQRRRHPMVPLGLFADRVFSAANLMTVLVYAALGALMFFLTLQLQTVAGYSPVQAGVAELPITVCLIVLAARGGRLGARIGPRIPMTVGPLMMALGVLALLRVDADTRYLTDVLPGLLVFGLGLALMVAPLTAAVLAAAPEHNAGVASGINNAVARTGSLLAVAALPAAVGLAAASYTDPVAFEAGFRSALLVCAGLLAGGALVSWTAMPGRTADR